jgi:hypothetical protein
MTAFKKTVSWSLVLLLAAPCLFARGARAEDVRKSVRDFVQGFYDWYCPTARKERGMSGARLVVKYRSNSFSPELVRALKIDSDAQARSPHELVGLDADPFVNAQEYADRCAAEKVTRKGDRYFVEVTCTYSGRKSADADVVPELARKNGQWFFVDFHDKETGLSLLGTLKSLRENRLKHHRH